MHGGEQAEIATRPYSPPHFAGDIFFFGACGVGVDGGGGELGVTEPFLEEVEGNAGGDGGDAEAVAEAFGGGVGAGEPGGLHDGMDGAPAGHA